MSSALEGAVELLERSLAYTRTALAGVRPEDLGRATPCAGWSLERLLAHMEDALDAFLEAAAGEVAVREVPPTTTRVEALREKACALLGAWVEATPSYVAVGDAGLSAPVLVATAALEIAVHGWDVAQATGARTPLPDDLAGALLGVALAVVGPEDRGGRFGWALPLTTDAPPSGQLLAHLGRRGAEGLLDRTARSAS